MKVKGFLDFMRSRRINETSMSSDWDADYGLSQGPIDSDTKLNIDMSPGFYTAEPSEYDFESEEDGNEKLLDPEKKERSSKKRSHSDLKALLKDLEERVSSLEKAVY